MKKNNLPLLLSLLAVIFFLSCGETKYETKSTEPKAVAAKPRKNIVLFVSDDHGKTAGCYGDPVIQTPHMDQLAAEGTLFTHAFATSASCTASRSVILTGLQNHRTGLFGHMHFPAHFTAYENLKSLPVLLQEGGYRTATGGKYHVAPKEVFDFEKFITTDDLPDPENSRHIDLERNAVMLAEACRNFINEEDERPFFLYVCTSDPHRHGASFDKPNRFGNKEGGYKEVNPIKYAPEDVTVPAFLPDTKACREELAEYYQSISRMDQGIGRLVDILKEAGAYENTLFIYMSDHGMAFPGAKTTTYDPGLNSPLIVRSPDVQQRGLVTDAMVSWTDITPTILDFAGVEIPLPYPVEKGNERPDAQVEVLDGRSFLPVLEQEHPQGYDEVYASHTFHEIQMYYPMRVVRDREYKLIWNIAWQLPYPFASDLWGSYTWQTQYKQGMDAPFGQNTVGSYIQRDEFELFDIKNDPNETKNLAGKAEHAATLKTYQAKLKAFQERSNDRWVRKWTYQ